MADKIKSSKSYSKKAYGEPLILDPSKYVFFCSHERKNYSKEDMRGCLSQWFPAKMIGGKVYGFDHLKIISVDVWEEYVDGREFPTCEHWMMLWKALLFGDLEVAKLVRNAKTPKDVKALGRKVKGFTDEEWAKHREDIVLAGNILKFSQHGDLREFLIGTGDREIVEAAHYDRIWGIGFNERDAIFTPKEKWGKNLLGKTLMIVRDRLAKN